MTDRITLRPAEAAAYVGCSPATIYRWAKTLEHFPQPHRMPGRRVTVWYQDELDKWLAAHGATHANILGFAWQRSEAEMGSSPDEAEHPFITAYLLAGGDSLERLAFESGIPEARLRELSTRYVDVTDEELTGLFSPAAAQVLYREKQLAQQFSDVPNRQNSAKFRREVANLDKAHRLCFGQRLLTHLLREGRTDGNA